MKKTWLVLIASLIIVVFGLAVIVYKFKTPTDFGYTPNNWDLIFDFLDKWASAGAPALTLLAVAVALGIGVSNILLTRKILNEMRRPYEERKMQDAGVRGQDVNGS